MITLDKNVRGVDRVGSMDAKRYIKDCFTEAVMVKWISKKALINEKNSKLFENNRSGETVKSTPDITTEGPERQNRTFMIAKDRKEADFVTLRTVPVIVKNGNRRIKVNALLDDASTKNLHNYSRLNHFYFVYN